MSIEIPERCIGCPQLIVCSNTDSVVGAKLAELEPKFTAQQQKIQGTRGLIAERMQDHGYHEVYQAAGAFAGGVIDRLLNEDPSAKDLTLREYVMRDGDPTKIDMLTNLDEVTSDLLDVPLSAFAEQTMFSFESRAGLIEVELNDMYTAAGEKLAVATDRLESAGTALENIRQLRADIGDQAQGLIENCPDGLQSRKFLGITVSRYCGSTAVGANNQIS